MRATCSKLQLFDWNLGCVRRKPSLWVKFHRGNSNTYKCVCQVKEEWVKNIRQDQVQLDETFPSIQRMLQHPCLQGSSSQRHYQESCMVFTDILPLEPNFQHTLALSRCGGSGETCRIPLKMQPCLPVIASWPVLRNVPNSHNSVAISWYFKVRTLGWLAT